MFTLSKVSAMVAIAVGMLVSQSVAAQDLEQTDCFKLRGEKAMAACNEILQGSTDSRVFLRLGELLLEQRNFPEAVKVYERGLRFHPQNSLLQAQLTVAKSGFAEWKWMQEAQKKDASKRAAAVNKADVFKCTRLARSAPTTALKSCDAALAGMPDDPTLLEAKGDALQKIGKKADAYLAYAAAAQQSKSTALKKKLTALAEYKPAPVATLEPKPKPAAAVEPAPTQSVRTEPMPAPKGVVESEPDPAPNRVVKAEPKPEPMPAPERVVRRTPKRKPTADDKIEPEPAATAVAKAEPEPKPVAEVEPEPQRAAKTDPSPVVVAKAETRPEPVETGPDGTVTEKPVENPYQTAPVPSTPKPAASFTPDPSKWLPDVVKEVVDQAADQAALISTANGRDKSLVDRLEARNTLVTIARRTSNTTR